MQFDAEREVKRLRELHRYQILDTRREPEFDAMCELARKSLRLSMAGIAFVDRDRVWYKAASGVALTEVPRAGSLVDAAASEGGHFEIEDAASDPRFRNNPCVRNPPFLSFFASVPLVSPNGYVLGVLCVGDLQARKLDDGGRFILGQIAKVVSDRIRLHRIKIERTRENARKRARNAKIAEQKSEIGKQRRLLEQTSRIARIGGWEYDVQERRLVWSAEIFKILDLDPNGQQPAFEDVPQFYHPDMRDEVVANIKDALRLGRAFEMDFPILPASGAKRWVRCLCEAECDRTGAVRRLIGTIQDITDQIATKDEITYIATHDVLTGLPNRAVFQDRLAAALKVAGQDVGRCVGLVLVDVDHFKEVNDTLGHPAGDALLAEVGRRLTEAAGPDGLVARLGGDEFAIMSPVSDDGRENGILANRIMALLQEPVAYGDESIPVTASLGSAVGRSGELADQLFKDADIALYEAKASGRNRTVPFNRSMRDEIELRQLILRAIRHAIEADELLLYYQPQYGLRSEDLFGFEALLRWKRPDGFVAGPAFFGIALEDPQLSLIIGDLVLDQAVRQAAAWHRAGYPFGHIAVNFSTSQFRRGDLAEMIIDLLARHAVPPAMLSVEVTENVLLARDSGNVVRTLARLSGHGIRIALDDFGTGYASLTHLKEFPVDLLKIDRSFVSTLLDQRESAAIVRGVIALAHDLGVAVISEGIETVEQRDMLRALGSDYAQGYLFARPMPAEDAEDLLRGIRMRATG
ncbi:EAL domain-containing protein [Chthonobacter albigriseus]|uniref:EAL domain-containing protein n=1 Tax=Chthonobacter albigriseus TaxID=1683161 RepID=UPI0015EF5647|nr:EAL domain-containing protein [Chthonobacter albigriseus]